jgi:hypothetical protein
MSSLKINFSPSATGTSKPKGPWNSGPMRCCTAAEIFRSNQVATRTPTVAPISINTIGNGIQMALAVPGGMPKSMRDSIKIPWMSIPAFIILTTLISHGVMVSYNYLNYL